MTTISKRHHYLPEFFIKGFIAPSKQLWVYDKIADKILPFPKSPKSIFFEWNKNNITIDGNEIDILEKYHYKYIDDIISNQFRLIQNVPINEIEQQDFVNYITLMAAITFYRTPATEEWTNQLTQMNLRKKLPKNIEELIKKIYTLPLGRKDRKKIIDCFAPFLNFFLTDKDLMKGEGHYKVVESPNSCFVLSDNPILYENSPKDFNDLTNSLIFPLTAKRVYYGLNNNHYTFNIDIINRLNILLTIQAKQYFASPDKLFLEQLVKAFSIIKPVQGKFWEMTKELFVMINK